MLPVLQQPRDDSHIMVKKSLKTYAVAMRKTSDESLNQGSKESADDTA
jgi:hypothetical protein